MKKILPIAWWLILILIVSAWGFTWYIEKANEDRIFEDAKALYSGDLDEMHMMSFAKDHMINCSMVKINKIPSLALIGYLAGSLVFTQHRRLNQSR